MTAAAYSLRWLLVRRLVLLQALMLTTLVLTVVAALWAGGYLVSLEPEDELIEVVRDAVVRDASGVITIRQTPALVQRHADMPDLWFLVRDTNGHVLSQGNVPVEFARVGAALDDIGQARLGWNIGDPPRATARMRWVDTPGGKLQIMTGSGSKVPWHRLLIAVATLLISVVLPIAGVMALTTLIATPMVIRRSLAGLRETAAQAGRIDADRRGMRLPLDRVPREIGPLVEAVNDALRRLDEGYERRQRFLANAAHEVRTPIAILHTRIELLAASPQTAQLLEDVKRLSTLADQLLDVERLEQTAAPRTPVDLVATTRHVTADLAPLAIAAGYEIAFEDAAGQLQILGDEGAIERAIANLIQNAIQYGGRRGKIAVRVSPFAISVTDDGPGVPADERERVFEPFYRAGAVTRGAGLGLNLVREIARRHQARVAIHDSAAGGACVTITFGARPHLH
jgi:signal transduction histidine kinase